MKRLYSLSPGEAYGLSAHYLSIFKKSLLLFILSLFGTLPSATAQSFFPDLISAGENLFFSDQAEGYNGGQLWITDGTAGGTRVLRNHPSGGTISDPQHLTNVNGTLFFTTNITASQFELWKSDGTEAGTIKVKDIPLDPPAESSYPQSRVAISFTAVGSTLFFTGNAGGSSYTLWKSDGTASGTVSLKTIARTG